VEIRAQNFLREVNNEGRNVNHFNFNPRKGSSMKPIYFCYGDFRSGEKEYRIFKVQSVQDAYNVASELDYEIILDNTLKDNLIRNPTERTIISILETIERYLHGIENVVSCHRVEYGEAQRMKKHFLNADMAEYFPKKLAEPVVLKEHPLPNGEYPIITRRMYSWISEYWQSPSRAKSLKLLTARTLSPDEELIHAAAIREKRR
jgi:hypothetical protein